MLEAEEVVIGRYRVRLITKNDEVLGAVISGARLPRPLYISRVERIRAPKLPLSVKRYLRKKGFALE
jgi:hypothetical protein